MTALDSIRGSSERSQSWIDSNEPQAQPTSQCRVSLKDETSFAGSLQPLSSVTANDQTFLNLDDHHESTNIQEVRMFSPQSSYTRPNQQTSSNKSLPHYLAANFPSDSGYNMSKTGAHSSNKLLLSSSRTAVGSVLKHEDHDIHSNEGYYLQTLKHPMSMTMPSFNNEYSPMDNFLQPGTRMYSSLLTTPNTQPSELALSRGPQPDWDRRFISEGSSPSTNLSCLSPRNQSMSTSGLPYTRQDQLNYGSSAYPNTVLDSDRNVSSFYMSQFEREPNPEPLSWLENNDGTDLNELSCQMSILQDQELTSAPKAAWHSQNISSTGHQRYALAQTPREIASGPHFQSDTMFMNFPEPQYLQMQTFSSSEFDNAHDSSFTFGQQTDIDLNLTNSVTKSGSKSSSQRGSTPMTRSTNNRKRNQNKQADLDETLVRLRRKGMSYKAIMKEGNWGLEESTLRGRFRTVTKRKEERLRKPVWDEHAERALLDAVESEAPRRDLQSPRCLGKVPWKKVAQWMVDNRGCYKYGNATVKKKYMQLIQKQQELMAQIPELDGSG